MDTGVQLVGEGGGLLEQCFGGERQPFDADIDLDTPVGRAVPVAVCRRIVLERVEVVLGVGDVVRQHGADADLAGGARQVGQAVVHVVDGRRPALELLTVTGQSHPVGLLRVDGANHRVPAGLEVLPQR